MFQTFEIIKFIFHLVIEEQLVGEDGRVEHDLLLLQFAVKFLIRHAPVLEEKFCQLFDLQRKIF